MSTVRNIALGLIVFASFITIAFAKTIKTDYETLNAENEIIIGTVTGIDALEKRKRTGIIVRGNIIEWNLINGEQYISKISSGLEFIPKGFVFDLVLLEEEQNSGDSSELDLGGDEISPLASDNLGETFSTLSSLTPSNSSTSNEPLQIFYDKNQQPYIQNADGSITYIPEEIANQLINNGLGVLGGDSTINSEGAIYYLDENGKIYKLENGEKVYYDTETKEFYSETANGEKIYYTSDGEQAYILNDDGSITYIPKELAAILENEETPIIYYDQEGNPYFLSETGSITYIPQELADTLVNEYGAIYYTEEDSLANIIGETTPESEIEQPPENNIPEYDDGETISIEALPEVNNDNPVDRDNSDPDDSDISLDDTENNKIESSNREIICSVTPNYEEETVQTTTRKETIYTDNTKETTNCDIVKNFVLVKDFEGCSLRHDYHEKTSYKQAEYYYYNNLGEKKKIKGCSDTSVQYPQFEITTDCPVFFDKENLLLYKQRKLYINNEGSIEFVKDCFISTANPIQLTIDDQKTEWQETEVVDFENKKAFKKYKKYYDINGERYYTSIILTSSEFYTIRKEYETCNYQHRITSNISYKQFRWVYIKDNNDIETVRDCTVDENLSYGHITDNKFCSAYYINGKLYKKKQTYFKDDSNQIVVVKTCSPSTDELAIDPLKLVKSYSCTPDIDYLNMRVNLKYYETYPVANSYVRISDCKSDNNFVPLSLTTQGCEEVVNVDGEMVRTTERYTYNNGEEDKFIGFCETLESSQVFPVQDDSNKCSMLLNSDKSKLLIYSQKYYHNTQGEELLIGGCYNTGETTSVEPYKKAEYSNCDIVANEDFTRGYKSYREIVELPNGVKYTLGNCLQDEEVIHLQKDYSACVNEVNTQLGQVLERAKIFYIENGEKKSLNNTSCSFTGIQHDLEKEYGTCDPRQKIIQGAVYPYFAWKYRVGGETIYPLTNCSLEATSHSKLIDDFTCSGEWRNKIKFNSSGIPILNAEGNPDNLAFTNYPEKKYALIQSKKIYQVSGSWYIDEPCASRGRFGSATHEEEFKRYNYYDDLKIQKIVNQIVITKNIEGVFEDANADHGVNYSLGSIPRNLKVTIEDEVEGISIPYTYASTPQFNLSHLRGGRTTEIIEETSTSCRYNNNPVNTHTSIVNSDGGTTTTQITYSNISQSSTRHTDCRDQGGIQHKITYTKNTTIVTTHKIIVVEKFYKIGIDNSKIPVYYKVDEYITEENASNNISTITVINNI